MTTIVDEFTNGMSADTARANMRAVVEAYGYDGSGNAGDVRAFANTLLVPAGRSIGAAELGGGLRSDWNLLRNPPAAAQAMLDLIAGSQHFPILPSTVFSDDAGTTPAVIGGPVGAVRDMNGDVVATATGAARPTFGVHPASGVRNRANGAHNTGNSTFWKDSETQNGITVAKLSSSPGRVRYSVAGVATAESTIQVYSRANSDAVTQPSAQWLASLTAQVFGSPPPSGSGLRVLVREADASDAPIGLVSSTPFNSTSATPLTRDITISTGARVSAFIDVRIASGLSVDFEFELTDFQFENSASRTAYQANMSQFNITEAGVRSVTEFDADGITDWMQLASNFAPAGAYSIAAAIRTTGAECPRRSTRTRGGVCKIRRISGSVTRKYVGVGNVRQWSGGSPGTQILMHALRGTTDYDVHAQRRTLAENVGAALGNIFPVVNPFNAVGREGANYGAFRATCLMAFNVAISDATRTALQIVNAARIGVTLP
jgi:hypothetical protein